MAFFLFLLVNATLFLRPAEIVPDWQGWWIYEALILACFALALPDILRQFSSTSLGRQPIVLCVLGILALVVLSQLSRFEFVEAGRTGFHFLKVVIYVVLLVSLVTTPRRVHVFVASVVCFAVVLCLITVLQYHDVITLPTVQLLKETHVDGWSSETTYQRLQGTGIFQDPNDFCVMLATALPLCLYLAAHSRLRLGWLLPAGLFGYGILLTQSRGGFLAFLAGLGALTWARYGPRRAVALGLLGLPVLVVLAAGRQTEITADAGTGQSRIQLWSDWMMEFRSAPILGNGMPLAPGPEDDATAPADGGIKHLAHNSYLQAFADLGLIGGTLFLGAFYFALAGLAQVGGARSEIADRGLRDLQPYLLGAVSAFAAGLLTLSLCYLVPTYLVLGLASAYLACAAPHHLTVALPRFDGVAVRRLAVLSVGFLGSLYVFVRVFIRWA